MKKKKCPICGGQVSLVAGNNIWRALFWFLVFRPVWIVLVIRGQADKKYKCEVCGHKFARHHIEK